MPDAFYNCVASFRNGVQAGPQVRLADIAAGIDADLRASIDHPRQLAQMAKMMSWVCRVDALKAPLRIKKRVFSMGSEWENRYTYRSYLGDPLDPGRNYPAALADYIQDFEVWSRPTGPRWALRWPASTAS